MEIRFRLNPNNRKDKMIIDFLECEYSASEAIKALIYKMATNDSKGTILSFWGNVNTVNVLGNQESDTTIDDNGHLKESSEIHEISENDQNGQPLPHIDEDIKSFFE
ncbi:hypothetical protein [uncultured Clostridium sp.]|uniref:hypothetical protein n=1 Tax=uncultured Clostridium sp. TaxID=59620 RepID=UPI002673463A|nr:hypothetical protein [uncultured Clostridium sp.]